DVPAEAVVVYEEMWQRECPELERFQRFWAAHDSVEPPIVVSVPGGMLHFMYECVSHLPRDRRVVAVGSGLSDEEERWAAATLGVPFHAIHLDCDDKTLWEYLFATARHGFVWMDADCFLLDTRLLDGVSAGLGPMELRGVFGRPGEG